MTTDNSSKPALESKTQPMTSFRAVRPQVSFPEMESLQLQFWDEHSVFEKSLEQTAHGKSFLFYDGPPFATGTPHYGHLLAGTLKDMIPRYQTMKGRYVARRFGWDCHGLPVEFEINKKLNIETSRQVYEMGVATYNAACRKLVTEYTSDEWRTVTKMLGRWVDMDHPYTTMDLGFMQSVWWVFSELYQKGLIQEGYKVVPYSTGVSTALSNFEAQLNYKEVQDPAVTVRFPAMLASGEKINLLAWTTTPWTLPSNMALMIHKDLPYALCQHKETAEYVIVALALIEKILGDSWQFIREIPGRDLIGLSYKPAFSFFSNAAEKGAFRVIHADHVTADAGTGVVHAAPAFGEEDFIACEREGVPLVNPVDDDGLFLSSITPWAGKRVKDADPEILADLKKRGLAFRIESITHSYPYCWRSDTPLIYRAVSSWFVRIDPIKESLLRQNQKTRWVPEHLRDGRFGKWLENARDWAISRNRFWGTPLPIWKNKQGETRCFGSVHELEKATGATITDIHLENVMNLTVPSAQGGEPLRHIGLVLDCWFESGSMPVAQLEYPFRNQEVFKNGFPADFIAEGLDQTRGWFYTLMVLSTALFDQPAFQNVIVNGLILAEDGKKMSKRLKNYPDPKHLIREHGADSLRLYMVQSPAVRAQELKFSEKGVREVVRKILLRWWNAYSFFINYANVDGFVPNSKPLESPNALDQWLLSRLGSLVETCNREMDAYRLYAVIPELTNFIEELTNTYIRFNRRHFWEEGMSREKQAAYQTLHTTLLELCKLMAPFTPFITEEMYQNLAQILGTAKLSVHLESYPEVKDVHRDLDLEQAVRLMGELVEMARFTREKMGVKAKIPLREIQIIVRDAKVLSQLRALEPYFSEELNARKFVYLSNEEDFVHLSAKANFQKLGRKLGKEMKTVAGEIAKLSMEQILSLEAGHSLLLGSFECVADDLDIRRAAKLDVPHFSTSRWLSVFMDPEIQQDQLREGKMREIIRAIQSLRKTADLRLDTRIALRVISRSKELTEVMTVFAERIRSETLTRWIVPASGPWPEGFGTNQAKDAVSIDDEEIELEISWS